MNNLRLLTGLLAVALSGGGVCADGQPVVTLEEIFRTAETHSAQLRPSLSAYDEAVREISVARTGRMPEIDASLSLGYMGDGFTTKRNFSDFQKAPIPHFGNGLSLKVNQPVYTGGAVKRSIEMAELKSMATQFAADFQRDNLRFRLTGFYLDLYKYTRLRGVVEGNLRAAEKVLAEMKARHEQGTVLQNDITRYELLVADLELQRIKIDNALRLFNAHLVTASGFPEGTVIVPDSTILARSLPKDGESRWQEAAETRAPSLSLARSEVEISRKAEALVRAGRLPKVGLQAGWKIDGPILVEVPPVNRNLSYWYVGVGVSYDLSSLFKSNRSLAKSRMATQRALDELEAIRENVSLTVKEDYVHYLEAYEELKTRMKSVELAERNYHTVATRYSADMALITDLLDAANARLDAERQLVDARIHIIYYYYKLLFTTGKI